MVYKLYIQRLVSFAKKEIEPVIICKIRCCHNYYVAKVTIKSTKKNLFSIF